MSYIKILEECAEVAKDRQQQYGEATESIKLATEMLDTMFGIKLTPKEYCFVMVCLKLSRQKFQFKKDNLIDSVNYLAISIACEEKYGDKSK